MPAPMNAHLTPPPNTWEGGQFKVPDGVMQMLAARQGGAPMMGAPGGGGGMGAPPSSWAQYGFNNPDVMAEWQKLGANPKNPFGSADEYFKWHYGKFGQAEGRQGAPGANDQPFVDQFAQKRGGNNGILSLLLGGAAPALGQNPGGVLGMLGR